MSLTEQPVDVPLLPMNQQSLAIGGPVGRVQSMNNMVARKVVAANGGGRLRYEKRPGVTPLPQTTKFVTTGTTGVSPVQVSAVATLGDQLVEVGSGIPYVYTEANLAWEQYAASQKIDTRVLQRKPVANANAVLYAPDVAAVGNVLCYTYISRDVGTSARTGYVSLVDGNGVQVRAPFAAANSARLKVVSDGAVFWVFSQPTARTSTTIQVFDANGVQLATSTINWGVAVFSWDAHWDAVGGAWLATPTAINSMNLRQLTYAAGVISFPVNNNLNLDATSGVGFLENSQGDAHIYIGMVNAAFNVNAYQINSTGGAIGTLNHAYVVDAVNAVYIGNITGYVKNSSFDIVVAYSIIQNTPLFAASFLARNNFTSIVEVTFAGVASQSFQLSLSLASRAFQNPDGNWSAVMYYQSSACFSSVGTFAVGPSDVSLIGAQPTFFVTSLTSVPFTGGSPVLGQFETGFAYQFFQSRNSLDLYPFHLSSMATEFQSTTAIAGAQHIPLGYLGQQQSANVTVAGNPYNVFVALSGIRDYVFMPVPGTAVRAGDALLLPGLRATRFDGDSFVEDGFALAPEIVSLDVTAAGGNLTNGEAYTWACVYEWLDGNGDVVESAISEPISGTPAAVGKQASLVISTDRTTAKSAARISVYRTFSPSLTTEAGVILRKVGEIKNNPTADTVTFVDQLSDASVQIGQLLYSQILDLSAAQAIDYFSAPAFRNGCFFENRAFVVGYDNAVWFSEQKVDGHAMTWSPLFRVTLPTTDTILSIVPMDTRVVILCDKSLWSIDGGSLPNATLTSGAIPTPQQFPLTTGALGPAFTTPIGAVYATKSGAWSLDRSLAPQYVGAAVQDETGVGIAQFTSATVDSAQRVYFTMSTKGNAVFSEALSEIVVYDLVVDAWYVWHLSFAMLIATQWQGHLTLVDQFGKTWVLDDAATSSYTDNGAPIPSTLKIAPIPLTAVNGYACVWQVQFFGQWKGAHDLTMSVYYDGSTSVAESFDKVINSDPGVYRYEFVPKQPDCQDIAISLSDNTPAGNSFSIETLTMLVGVEQGLGRISPTANRMTPV